MFRLQSRCGRRFSDVVSRFECCLRLLMTFYQLHSSLHKFLLAFDCTTHATAAQTHLQIVTNRLHPLHVFYPQFSLSVATKNVSPHSQVFAHLQLNLVYVTDFFVISHGVGLLCIPTQYLFVPSINLWRVFVNSPLNVCLRSYVGLHCLVFLRD